MRRALGTALVVAAGAALLGGCGDGSPAAPRPAAPATSSSPAERRATTSAPPTSPESSPATTAARPLAERLCSGGEPSQLATVSDPALTEVSGLAASARQPGVLWAISDSGAPAELVAIDLDGRALATVAVQGAENVDWEDLALLPREVGPDQLVIADVGDNARARSSVALYLVPEPDVGGGETVAVAERWDLVWPDGPQDSEALVADPETGELLLFSKHLLGGSTVVRVPSTAGPRTTAELEVVGELETGLGEAVTAADVSRDGSAVAVRTYISLLVFDRAPGTTVADALAGRPCRADAPPERQGETVTWLADGRGVATVSEGGDQPLWLVPLAP